MQGWHTHSEQCDTNRAEQAEADEASVRRPVLAELADRVPNVAIVGAAPPEPEHAGEQEQGDGDDDQCDEHRIEDSTSGDGGSAVLWRGCRRPSRSS